MILQSMPRFGSMRFDSAPSPWIPNDSKLCTVTDMATADTVASKMIIVQRSKCPSMCVAHNLLIIIYSRERHTTS